MTEPSRLSTTAQALALALDTLGDALAQARHQGMADSEERIARSRDRERQYQMLGRTGRIADYLP